MKKIPKCLRLWLLLLIFTLSGCSVSEHDELQKWMAEQKQEIKVLVPPLPEPTKFTPQVYKQEDAIEPFSIQKLAAAFKRDTRQTMANTALIAPELSRRKEILEAMPLDSFTMVGSLLTKVQPVGLVRVDNLIHQVRVGGYLGQNYGRITKISENEIVLREIVQDASGEWTTRVAALKLKEASK